MLKSVRGRSSDPIILTERPVEILWSPTSERFAVNHWADLQARDFFVVVTGSAQRVFIDFSPLVDLHFPSPGVALRRAAKAHRWTTTGDLVIRCLFQRMEEPYAVFACEVLVGFSDAGPSLVMLRGFIQE